MSPYTTDGRKLLATQHHHRDRNLGTNSSPSTSSMASAMAAAAAAAAMTNGNNDGGLALSLGSSSGLQTLRSPPLGSPLDLGPHMYSPARGSFFDQPLSASADARSYSHLTAAIHRQEDSTSLHDARRKLSTTSSNGYDSLSYANNSTNGSGRIASSPGADLSSSPFGQRSLFLHPNNTPSSAVSMPPPSSSLSRHAQALHSIPESSSHFLDVPQRQRNNNFGQDYFGDDDHNDLNDAMLPSSLNELLTPNELQLRKAREHQHQQLSMSQRNYPTTNGAGLEHSSSESMRYKTSSPLAAKSLDMAYAAAYDPSTWQQAFANNNNKNDDFYDDQLLQQSTSVGNTNAINIPGGSKPAKAVSAANLINHHQHQDEYRTNKSSDNDLFSPFTEADDEGPFYMEDAGPILNAGVSGTISGENGRQINASTSTTATTDDRHRLLTPFEFPSLKS